MKQTLSDYKIIPRGKKGTDLIGKKASCLKIDFAKVAFLYLERGIRKSVFLHY